MKERQRWQPEEDALLRAYVKQYGPKEWNLVSQRMGKPLDRDAKSCLERWKNYLKPGIKKGSLTPEEQSLVISLQAKYGNKWKKIASEVPGRTAKRLGKWWEVFKEKQLKQSNKTHQQQRLFSLDSSANSSIPITPSAPLTVSSTTTLLSASPEQGKYDHILETFAEKYVQPKLQLLPSLLMPNLSLSDAPHLLSLSAATTTTTTTSPPSMLLPWMTVNNSSTSSLSSSSSTTASPSVSLSLSPTDLSKVDPVPPEIGRLLPVHELATLVQYCKELEEGRQNWLQHKKEAMWRLSRLEQQLESEKNRKKRETMEEVETKIRCLREEEMSFLDGIERECREQLNSIYRDAEAKEAKMMDMWSRKHVKLAKLVEQQLCSFNSLSSLHHHHHQHHS